MKKTRFKLLEKILNSVIIAIFLIYILVLLKIILFKYISPLDLMAGNYAPIQSLNLIPLNSILQYANGFNFITFFSNIYGNILIFMPLGIFLCLIFKNLKCRFIILSIFFISFLFELLQYACKIGSTDIDDIILNVIGGIIGIVIYKIFNKLFTNKIKFLLSIIILCAITGLIALFIILNYYPYLLNFNIFSKNIEIEIINEELFNSDINKPDIMGSFVKCENNILTVEKTSLQFGYLDEQAEIKLNEKTNIVSRTLNRKTEKEIYTFNKMSKDMLASLDYNSGMLVWLDSDDNTIADEIIVLFLEE